MLNIIVGPMWVIAVISLLVILWLQVSFNYIQDQINKRQHRVNHDILDLAEGLKGLIDILEKRIELLEDSAHEQD